MHTVHCCLQERAHHISRVQSRAHVPLQVALQVEHVGDERVRVDRPQLRLLEHAARRVQLEAERLGGQELAGRVGQTDAQHWDRVPPAADRQLRHLAHERGARRRVAPTARRTAVRRRQRRHRHRERLESDSNNLNGASRVRVAVFEIFSRATLCDRSAIDRNSSRSRSDNVVRPNESSRDETSDIP